MQNQILIDTIKELRRIGKSNDANVWLAVADMLDKPRSRRREVNLDKLNRYTNENSKVVVAGKVLGKGNLDHKIILGAFAISEQAARKVIDAGGEILTLDAMAKRYPDGKGVMIIG